MTMFEFEGIAFGPTTVTVEAETLQGALEQMGTIYRLHKDALFLAAHVEHFYDVEADVVPKSSEDQQGYTYRGFECLVTGCNITFIETEDGGIYPGRYRAYKNGSSRPKLYDPQRGPDEILSALDPSIGFVRQFGADVNSAGGRSGGRTSGGSQRTEQPGGGGKNGQQEVFEPDDDLPF